MAFCDFTGLAMDQLMNQAAKFRYMFGGKVNTPLVVRTSYGTGEQAGAQHSQTVYSMLAAARTQGCDPGDPVRRQGLLIQAIADPDPVLFFEHKMLYDQMRGEVPEGRYTVPLAKPRSPGRAAT